MVFQLIILQVSFQQFPIEIGGTIDLVNNGQNAFLNCNWYFTSYFCNGWSFIIYVELGEKSSLFILKKSNYAKPK